MAITVIRTEGGGPRDEVTRDGTQAEMPPPVDRTVGPAASWPGLRSSCAARGSARGERRADRRAGPVWTP